MGTVPDRREAVVGVAGCFPLEPGVAARLCPADQAWKDPAGAEGGSRRPALLPGPRNPGTLSPGGSDLELQP